LAEPGVGKFHTGAFAIAARTALPVVPVCIRGTRYILPSTRFLPRPGEIEIEVLPAIPMEDARTPEAVSAARDLARARIIAVAQEPDLCASPAPATE